jgi:hypothetical protein
MLSLPKKKSEADAPQSAAWHPNFRNYEKLPDIKVVRTAFFVNGAAILLAVSLSIYFGYKEWSLHVLRGQIASADALIRRDKPISDQAVAQFKKFQTEEARINEVDTFLKSKPSVSLLIIHLGRTLPPNIAIDSVILADNGLVLRISVKGGDAGPGFANAYLEQLKVDKVLTERFDPAEMTTITINPTTGRWSAEINHRLKGTKK